jgi:hypothetical protein
MPCWPDLWNEILRLGWLIGLLFALVLLTFMLWSPGIKWRWLRISIRIVAGLAAILIVPVAGLALLFVATDTKPEYRTVNSPTGLHQATLTYHAGFLGRDFSQVRIKSKSCCKHFTAYEYAGPSDITETKMTWIDDSHLQIEYYSDPERMQHCQKQVADVLIICKALQRTQ